LDKKYAIKTRGHNIVYLPYCYGGKFLMITETQECEENIAIAWHEGVYDQSQAELTCEIQSLNFQNVVNKYAELYEQEQVLGAFKWN
jgi:hypothetical protein